MCSPVKIERYSSFCRVTPVLGVSADTDFLWEGDFSNRSCFYIPGIEYLTMATVCIHVGRKG